MLKEQNIEQYLPYMHHNGWYDPDEIEELSAAEDHSLLLHPLVPELFLLLWYKEKNRQAKLRQRLLH